MVGLLVDRSSDHRSDQWTMAESVRHIPLRRQQSHPLQVRNEPQVRLLRNHVQTMSLCIYVKCFIMLYVLCFSCIF